MNPEKLSFEYIVTYSLVAFGAGYDVVDEGEI
jgi:hypothetical protein